MKRESAAERRRAAGTICTYCGEERLTGRQAPEHPIPAVLDSAITVYTSCDRCNSRAGREVDQPWLQHVLVQAERARWQPAARRRRGRRTPHPIIDGIFQDEDGHRVVAHDGVPRYPGSIVHAGDRVSIKAETEARADELRARVERQLAAEGLAVRDYSVTRRAVRPRVKTQISVSVTAGVRMGAKLGLAFGAEAFDEDWRRSGEAVQLREWLWSDSPRNGEGELLAWMPGTETVHPLAEPPNHVAFFMDGANGVFLTVLVFGRLGFAIPVAPAGTEPPQRAWRAGPAYGKEVAVSFEDLLVAAVKRATDM